MAGELPPDNVFTSQLQTSYRHLTVAQKILLWPKVYDHIERLSLGASEDLAYVANDGTPWFVHLELAKHPKPLPSATTPRTFLVSRPSLDENRTAFQGLTLDTVNRLVSSYFETFNVLHPLLDEDIFQTDMLLPMIRYGYVDGDASACIVLLVLSLIHI